MVSGLSRIDIYQRRTFPLLVMDATAVFHNLLDYNSSKRVEVLIVMRKLIRNSSHLPFRNMSRTSVFEVLSHLLDDVRWEVRYHCLLLIAAIIQNTEDEIDSCMVEVMPRVVSNLGHENSNIRRSALQVLHLHMKYTNNLQHFLKMFIHHGLESPEYVTRKGCIISVGILFTSEFSSENLSLIVESLAKQFVHGDASLFYPIFLALQKLSELVGPATFNSYLQRSDEEAVNTYKRVLNKFYFSDSCLSSSSGSRSSFSGNINEVSYPHDNKISKYDFGIFEPQILDEIKSGDWKIRIEGIEHMKMVLKETPDLCDQISDMDKFLLFLASLLSDSNFKIVNLTLSIYDLLIDKFRKEIRRFLKTFVSAVAKHLGDAKLVIREHAVKVIHKLMHHVRPSDVLSNLFEMKNHRNPRLREEIVNRVTAAVLTFPSYSLEFCMMCEAVAPLLIDTKRRVRLAALECFAVLAQTMGPSRLIPLVAAVDSIELHLDGEGLMAAVQARLARRILPKCAEDGSITYAISIPSSAGNQSRAVLSYGADIDWVMAASGSSSSSTPPSRSKESSESAALFSKAKVMKSKSDDLMLAMKVEEEHYTCSDEEFNLGITYENIDSTSFRRKSPYGNRVLHRDSASSVSKNLKGAGNLAQALLPSRMKLSSESPKTRPVIPGSKIPILTRNTSFRSSTDDESAAFERVSSRRATMSSPLPDPSSHNAMHSASKRSALQEGRCNNEGRSNSEDNILPRKISPCGSAVGSKTILVRSPSLSQIEHLPHWNTAQQQTEVKTVPPPPDEKFVSPAKQMGNIGSYFRSGMGDVIIAQPAPAHLDNVSDINVIVLDDQMRIPSSPSPKSWPSAELFHLSASDGYKTTGRQTPVIGMPDVYSVRRNSHFSAPAIINKRSPASPVNGIDTSNIAMFKINREKMLKKKQEILRETEERRIVREKNQQEHKQLLEKRLLVEKERQLRQQYSDDSAESEKYEDRSDHSDCAVVDDKNNNNTHMVCHSKSSTPPDSPSPPLVPRTPPDSSMRKVTRSSPQKIDSAKTLNRSSSLKVTSASKRTIQLAQPTVRNFGQMSKKNLAASSVNIYEDVQNIGLSPFPNPDEALKKALKSLSTETWMGKIEGIQTISRLAQVHPDVLLPHLHAVVLALLAEVKNLRSSVSRSAIMAVGELFSSLKRHMEQDLELIASTLLSKSGETVGFIREDIEKVMKLLLEAVTPNKAAVAIIAGGASHRNGAVRKTAANSLLGVVEKMGATRVLAAKDVSEKLFPTLAQFLMDGTPLTRYYARRICEMLMPHPAFDKLMLKYVQPNTLRNINSILDTVRKRGAGDMPKEKMSARTHRLNTTRRSGMLNRTM